MLTVLLIIHLLITLALIGVVLIQRSEGGGLGIGSSQGMGAFMTGRGTANLLTRSTAVLAGMFMLLSLVLALYSRGTSGVGHSIMDGALPVTSPVNHAPIPATEPATAPATTAAPEVPATKPPARPSVPTN